MPAARPPASYTLAAANTSYVIAPENQRRTTIAVTNLHDKAMIFLAVGHTAELNKGYPLFPGQSYHMDTLDNSPAAIHAISDIADVTVSIQEMGA